MTDRLSLLQDWLARDCGLSPDTLEPASEDASFRRYFRLTLPNGTTRIIMDAPPDKEDMRPFVMVAERMDAAGLHVPHIHARDLEQGFLLLEDLGSTLYLAVLDETSVDNLYGDAMSALAKQQATVPSDGLPPYDQALLDREMRLFPDWLLARHLELAISPAETAMLEHTFQALINAALEQPRVFVHRDYHSRNLMRTGARNPGIIDFQDAVAGPVTYDLVSLLKDCYIAWPLQRVDAWAMDYFRLAVRAGVLREDQADEFLRWHDLMGAQRHLKAAGIFARLCHRDGKSGYLQDIPRTLGYIVEAAGRRPELADLGAFIANRVLPAMADRLAEDCRAEH